MIYYGKEFLFGGFILSLVIVLSIPTRLDAQAFGPITDRFNSLSQNSVSSLQGSGSTLWIGPGLNAYFENSGEIYIPSNADSIYSGRGRVFSLSAQNDRVLAGLGYNSTRGGESAQTAMGYYQSIDRDDTWNFIDFPLDNRGPVECTAGSVGSPCDIEFTYGRETYIRTRITVPELSPPFEVDFHENTLMSVNWASGLLRSSDNGQTWERMILPPSNVSELNPDSTYEWTSLNENNEIINRYDPRYDNNLLGFGLLIDDNQTVWVGTAGGINISENALNAPVDEVKWRKISFNPDTESGLLANWIVSIRQQPGTNRIWMTNWQSDPENRDRNGIVYTEDGGDTFQYFLEGVRVNDIGFFDGIVFATADNGLFISEDDGVSWTKIDQIQSPNTFFPRGTRYFTVSATDQNLWIGTSDGIASTNDGGETWKIIRVDMPLSGGNVYQPDAPDADSYAYPNPFSPRQHSQVRIKFEAAQAEQSSIQIFDFGMNLIKSIDIESADSGSYEVVWDGTDQSGRLASNGTYFYVINKPSGRLDGKILLLD